MHTPAFTAVEAVTLTPLHYHSLAVPSGTATLATFLADRSMSYALAGALGALAPSAALPPQKDYRRDLAALPWLCSAFEAQQPRLLPPLGKRLNLDTEGGYGKKIITATGTGNLKTWFFIQEVPPGIVYHGAIFGPDPFLMASRLEGREVKEIIVRTGRHLSGILRLKRASQPHPVRLNAHTAHLFDANPADDPAMRVDIFALYDMQFTAPMALEKAATYVGQWRGFATATE